MILRFLISLTILSNALAQDDRLIYHGPLPSRQKASFNSLASPPFPLGPRSIGTNPIGSIGSQGIATSTGGIPAPIPIPSGSPLTTTLAALPSVTLPPSGVTIAPSGTTASAAAVVFGGVLLSLSGGIRSVDLTIPTAKAEAIQEVDDTIVKADNLFKDFGGIDASTSCSGPRKLKRSLNPFPGLETLAGDLTSVFGCTTNVLNMLKGNLQKDTPDPDLTSNLLDDINTLAEDAQSKNDPSNSVSQETATQTGSSQSRPSSSSGTASTSAPPSSSGTPSTSAPSSSVASCTACCPTDPVSLPTSGVLAVTISPDDLGPFVKRAIPERFHRIGKRQAYAKTVVSFNEECTLTTTLPVSLPAVTIPAYPGGFDFYKDDLAGKLGPREAVSRYYRSTTIAGPQCTPTITQISAPQWTFNQDRREPGNNKISIDHAYEINFLQQFFKNTVQVAGGISCEDAHAQFFDFGTCPTNHLEPIYNSLPSETNLDFIGMSGFLNNDAKGWVS